MDQKMASYSDEHLSENSDLDDFEKEILSWLEGEEIFSSSD